MAEIIVIAAVADNGVIGRGMAIPWHLGEDFRRFKELTLHHPCIMGRRTYESLPKRPLPGRENIVLTSDRACRIEGATVLHSLEEALTYVRDRERAFICGGEAVYRQGIERADRLELTRVHQMPDGDTFFPAIDFSLWELVSEDPRDGFTFQTYRRRSAHV